MNPSIEICLVGLAFMMIGPALMIVNSMLMNDTQVGFGFPFFVSALGPVFTAIAVHVMRWAGKLDLPHAKHVHSEFWWKNVAPVGVCQAITLVTGNAQYMFMGLALIQFLKAFTPLIVALFAWAILKRNQSMKKWFVLGVACAGTSMTAAGELSLSLFGLILALTSCCTEAIRMVLTEFMFKDCKFGILEGQYYLAPPGACCLLILSLLFEAREILAENKLQKLLQYPFLFLLAGTLGIGVQLVGARFMKLTGSVQSKVLAQFRNAIVVFSGVFVFGETLTFMQLSGYIVSVLAILHYSVLQQQRPDGPKFTPIQESEQFLPEENTLKQTHMQMVS